MLGVVIEGEPHPPITHIGPAVRASDHASEYLVQGIISASAGETLLKNYRPDLGDILRRIEVRISRIHFIHYRAGTISILDRPIGMGLLAYALASAMARTT